MWRAVLVVLTDERGETDPPSDSVKRLLKRINKKRDYVRGRLALLTLPEELQHFVAKGLISIESAALVANQPPDIRQALIKVHAGLNRGFSLMALRDLISTLHQQKEEQGEQVMFAFAEALPDTIHTMDRRPARGSGDRLGQARHGAVPDRLTGNRHNAMLRQRIQSKLGRLDSSAAIRGYEKMSDTVAAQDTIQELYERLQSTMSLEFMDPAKLGTNDLNWKKHPAGQRRAMDAFMGELEERGKADAQETGKPALTGWVDTVKYNKRTGRLLDGHMRQVTALERGDALIPVLVFDVDEETETLILRYMDPIGSMYEENDEAIERIESMIEVDNLTLAKLMKTVEEDMAEIDEAAGIEAPAPPPKRTNMPEGGLALPLGVKHDYVVLRATTQIDFLGLVDHFGLKRQKCPFTGSIGQGRVADGARYLRDIRARLEERFEQGYAQALLDNGIESASSLAPEEEEEEEEPVEGI